MTAFLRAGGIPDIETPPILRLTGAAGKMRVSGRAVVALPAGETEFPTPAAAIEAAHAAAPKVGAAAVRRAMSEGAGGEAGQAAVTASARLALAGAIPAAPNPGGAPMLAPRRRASHGDVAGRVGGARPDLPCPDGRAGGKAFHAPPPENRSPAPIPGALSAHAALSTRRSHAPHERTEAGPDRLAKALTSASAGPRARQNDKNDEQETTR